jgi:bifunctional DNase/RNase
MPKVEMNIDSLRVSLMTYQRCVILKEKSGNRVLPMWISSHGGDTIQSYLQDVQTSSYPTPDFVFDVITGADLKWVIVDRCEKENYYAKAILEHEKEVLEIDCQPSDAFALALKAKASIYVSEEILSQASVIIDPDDKYL